MDKDRQSKSMLRVKKMLNNMDNVVEWMNQVKQHGGVEEAEAARVATAENSTEQ